MRNFRRKLDFWIFSSLLQTYTIPSSSKPSQFTSSIRVNKSRPLCNKNHVSPSISAFPNPFSSSSPSNTAIRFSSTRLVGSEDDLNDSDANEDDENIDDFDLSQAVIKDEDLLRNVNTVLGCLDHFPHDAAEAKRSLEKCSLPVSPELVAEVLSRVRNSWEAAFTFFLWAGKQPGYVHAIREYHSMVSILAKMRKFDTAWALIDEMRGGKDSPSLVTPQTLLIMIRRYCAVHDVGKAIGAFYAFKRFGFKIGIEEFQDLLCALCRYKNVQDAEHLLLCKENVFPFDTKSFNIVLNGWCNMMVDLRQAKRFWWDMGRKGIARDAFSYGSMISCYSKIGRLRDVLKLFDEMKEVGIAPDRKVYNAVVYALAKGNCLEEAFNLVKTMEEKGCIPNAVTYNSLIRPLCKARKADDAQVVFDEMLQRGLSPSVRTYHAFFAILRTSEEVFELLDKMKKTGCRPTYDTYIMLIRKFCRWRQHDNVFRLWNDMGKNGLSPDRSSYIVLIHGLFLNGKLDEAYKYYEEMKTKGFSPEPRTDEMLEAWVSGKETGMPQMLELKGSKEDEDPLRKNHRGTSGSVGWKRDFLKQPEIRNVTREKGFSFW